MRLEWRDVAELADNPHNWREHPPEQTATMADLLDDVGWAGALLYNERTGRLIDGHDRKAAVVANAERLGTKVPVLIGSWSEEQEGVILATLDPVGQMATANQPKLLALLADARARTPGARALLDKLAGIKPPSSPGSGGEAGDREPGDERANTQATIGAYRFTIQRDAYEEWLEGIRQEVGFDDEAIVAELRRRLGLAA